MKDSFLNMQDFMEKRLEKRPSGWGLFTKELIATFLRVFDETARVVWVSCYAFPMELLWAFDVVPFDFEIACNLLPAATGGRGSTIMSKSEEKGYSRDICSFYRLTLGAQFQAMLPRGDLFLTSSYYCNGKAKTNEILARAQGGESVIFDVPNEISDSSIKYVVSQLKDIAVRLEKISGVKLDQDRLRDSVRWSNKARESYLEVNRLMKTKPCPWDGYTACLLGISGSLFWGSPLRDEINRRLVREMEERIKTGKLLPEKYRVLWFPWVPVQSTNIFTILRENEIAVPTVEVTRVYWPEMDENKPFESLALKALQNPYVGPAERRVKVIMELAGEYEVNGAIHFSTPACRHENGSFRLISATMRERGIPVLNIEADMTDERNYFPEQTMDRLSSFLEILRTR
ncbi:MAG: 2-hydroxyacyl-CoA dehydratase [Candidatus Tectomicrobia bacterium]|uniref:2-hydroxyacyl-CoA dehydratase n=1 Tax=Tectimicrobiota bacterium TaxID=2528274 RepID=A0A933GM08_UNCTE|nr:2-hydroxyacyl-CoA dehydratase [Candidatus Tectomicrobia bacterium]